LTKQLNLGRLPALVLCLLLAPFHPLFAQKSPQAYGQVDKADLLLSNCSFDPNAAAMVLFDVGMANCYVDPNSYSYDNLVTSDFEHHVRIKILSDKGLDKANVKIRYYAGNNIEDVKNMSAQTFNLDAAGNIVITKLGSDQVFRNKINNRYAEVVFVFPNVKVGSVIEYKYKKTAKSLHALDKWYFQEDIPVKYSSYVIDYPNLLDISVINKRTTDLVTKVKAGDLRTVKTYTLENIKALREEPYMTCKDDYLFQVDPLVLAVLTPGERKSMLKTWKEVITMLLEDEDFGLQLKRNIPRTSDLELLLSGLGDPYKKMNIIYDYVKQNMQWDQKDGLWALNGVRAAWKDKKGNAGEINLILVNLLRDAGLDAYPILVSTRGNGRVQTSVADIEQFNKVLAYVTIGDQHYVLDGTSSNTPVNMIPYDVLYTEGLVIGKIDKADWGWKFLWNEAQQFNDDILLYADIDEAGNINGEATITSKDYARLEKMNHLQKGKRAYQSRLESDNSGYTVDSLSTENEKTDSLPLVQHFKYQGKASTSGAYHYFSINQFSGMEKNPFVDDERFSDIFFGSNQRYRISAIINIPEGYVFDELPKNVRMITQDTSISFTRQARANENTLTATINISFARPFYAPENYPEFYEFYKKLFTFLKEQFVFRKK